MVCHLPWIRIHKGTFNFTLGDGTIEQWMTLHGSKHGNTAKEDLKLLPSLLGEFETKSNI